MKKKNIINLIKYYSEKNDLQFKNEVHEIAKYFDSIGDYQLAEYIMGIISDANTFIPQTHNFESKYLKLINETSNTLPLPDCITEDLKGIINAVNHNVGINKFLFEGVPGSGKTESAKQVSRLLDRKLYSIEINSLINSKMGETAKNVSEVFNEINTMPFPEKSVILFDEIDALALDRINSNDLREMGRVTSTILKEFESLNSDIVLLATTNLFDNFDKALTRRFDLVINFNRYSRNDLIDIAGIILNETIKLFPKATKDMKVFKKIISNMKDIPYPGDLKNMIKVALAFSDPTNKYDYLFRLLKSTQDISEEKILFQIKDMNFTVREIEVLTGISKSQVSRELKEMKNKNE